MIKAAGQTATMQLLSAGGADAMQCIVVGQTIPELAFWVNDSFRAQKIRAQRVAQFSSGILFITAFVSQLP